MRTSFGYSIHYKLAIPLNNLMPFRTTTTEVIFQICRNTIKYSFLITTQCLIFLLFDSERSNFCFNKYLHVFLSYFLFQFRKYFIADYRANVALRCNKKEKRDTGLKFNAMLYLTFEIILIYSEKKCLRFEFHATKATSINF